MQLADFLTAFLPAVGINNWQRRRRIDLHVRKESYIGGFRKPEYPLQSYSAAPTALTNLLGCHHLAVLERLVAHGLAKRPFFDDPMLEVLRERGLSHERAYVQHLTQDRKRVVEIDRTSANAFRET